MKKLAIILLAFISISCSKETDETQPNGEKAVNIEYTVENGNPDGIVSLRKYDPKNTKDIVISEVGSGSSFRFTDKVDNNFLFFFIYRTSGELKEDFKLTVKANGKTKTAYTLSEQHPKNSYINEGKVGNL